MLEMVCHARKTWGKVHHSVEELRVDMFILPAPATFRAWPLVAV
jgi:hypothetical protein